MSDWKALIHIKDMYISLLYNTKTIDNKPETDKFSQDMTKWAVIDSIGNVFNRLILFNSNRFHMSQDYFGDSKENGRLFQVFFFSTEK